MFDLSALLSLSLYERIDPNRSMEDNSIKMLWFTGGSFGGRMPLKHESPTMESGLRSSQSIRPSMAKKGLSYSYARYSTTRPNCN